MTLMAPRPWAGVALLALLAAAPTAWADHSGCPLFERLHYDYTWSYRVASDLFVTEHVVGFTDFRECNQVRDRVVTEEMRFESRGGAYLVHLVGEGGDEWHSLRPGANATAWYDRDDVVLAQFVGVSESGRVDADAGIDPPLRLPSTPAVAPPW